MASAPRVGQNNEKTMTREQHTITWIERTKTRGQRGDRLIKFTARSDEHPCSGTSGGWRRGAVDAVPLPWQHVDWWTARLQDPRTACLSTKQI